LSEQDKVDLLIALCDKKKPLSASDVAAIQQLLAQLLEQAWSMAEARTSHCARERL
jgi:hypothetical protein